MEGLGVFHPRPVLTLLLPAPRRQPRLLLWHRRRPLRHHQPPPLLPWPRFPLWAPPPACCCRPHRQPLFRWTWKQKLCCAPPTGSCVPLPRWMGAGSSNAVAAFDAGRVGACDRCGNRSAGSSQCSGRGPEKLGSPLLGPSLVSACNGLSTATAAIVAGAGWVHVGRG
ncbi:hypothetical protein VPH35_068469 [Triticum aestivum]